jgi:hypothetical protein
MLTLLSATPHTQQMSTQGRVAHVNQGRGGLANNTARPEHTQHSTRGRVCVNQGRVAHVNTVAKTGRATTDARGLRGAQPRGCMTPHLAPG